MKPGIVQKALLALVVATGLTVAVRPASAQDIAVIRIKAVDGVYVPGADVQTTSDMKFRAGSRVHVSRSAVSSLDGVRTLVLVERRSDTKADGAVRQNTTTEVMAVNGDTFTVTGVDGKSYTYAVDVLSDRSVDLLGPGDMIRARSGGTYQIWKIESASLMSRDRISLY